MTRELPILFSPAMIRANLADLKTETRRLRGLREINEAPDEWKVESTDADAATLLNRVTGELRTLKCPYGPAGTRLWVVTIRRISFGSGKYGVGDNGVVYDLSDEARPAARRVRLSHNGYEEINLRFRGESQAFRVNRLVCEAFYGACPPEFSVCRHLDGNRRNNNATNLDWGTPSQNSADANALGAWSGGRNKSSRLTSREIKEIREAREPQAILASRFGVTQPQISKIKSGTRWRTSNPEAPPANFPRWDSRLTLEVIAWRLERLQEITEAGAVAEGMVRPETLSAKEVDCWEGAEKIIFDALNQPRNSYRWLWDHLNGKAEQTAWAANPWVWVIQYRRCAA